MGDEKHYVYGVTDEPLEPFEADGVAGATEVYAIEYRSLVAIVSDVDTLEPEESEENVRAHNEVLQTVATRDGGRTVVPMQFGMVFEGERPLKNVLRNSRVAFTGALRGVEGHVEMGLKVVAPENGSVDEEAIREAVREELETLADGVDRGERFSERLVLNRSYLVAHGEREAFDSAVGRLEERFGNVTFQYSGPWAPYSFVEIEIGVAQ